MFCMRFPQRATFILSFVVCLFSANAFGQGHRPFFQFDRHNLYIDYLVNSARLNIVHPLNQPYRVSEISDSLTPETSKRSEHWNRLLSQDLLLFNGSPDTLSHSGRLIAGAEGGGRMNYADNDFSNSFYGNAFITYSYKNLGFYYRFDADEAFKYDNNYFGGSGKLGRPLIARTGIAYLQWDIKCVTIFAGRMPQNYGMINEPGLLLSSNPYSYDQIGLQVSNRVLRFSWFLSRLDDILGYDIRDTVTTPYWNKRYISVHRLELSLSKKFKLALSESVIFGGKRQDLLFQYLNPVNIYYISKMSDRKGYEEGDANVLMSVELFYKPAKRITFFTQFLLDDMDFTKELRKQFPDRVGVSSKVVYSDPFQGSQLYVKYNRISNWTYNSFYTWGNYTYYGKSLGYPKNGVENLTIGLDVFRFSPFIFNFRVKGEREREQNLKSPYIATKSSFPIGIPQSSLSSIVEAIWFPKSLINATISTEYIKYNNFQHISGNSHSLLNINFSLRIMDFFKLME